jgi:excisionase family DNA binding protein
MTDTPSPQLTGHARWASRADTAAHLQVSGMTVYRLTRDGILRTHKLGDTVRYDLNEVDAAMRSDAGTEATNLPPADDPAAELAPGDTHTYVSNACRHRQHGACGGVRPRAKCGYCSAACACTCHQDGE